MQKEIITMTKKESERLIIVNNLINKVINGTEASKQLGLSLRQVKRLKAKVILLEAKGIIHGNRGRESNRRIGEDLIDKIDTLLRDKYHFLTPTMAQEHLEKNDDIKVSKEKIRQEMVKEGLWITKERKRSEHRERRDRRDNYGEMQQFDGSYHKWFYGVDEEQCLLASIDDATGKITKAIFDKNEGIHAVFSFWRGYILENKRPVSIYLDRFSTYKINHKNAEDNKDLMTQFERVMEELSILPIHARSPQGKGRIERLWKTLQTRLRIELRLRGIKTIEEANKYLKEEFIPWFNAKFGVMPKGKADLHKDTDMDLDEVFSVRKDRSIGNDYVVRYENKYYQLSQVQPITVLKKSKVIVETRLDGEIKIKQRGKYLNFSVLSQRPEKEIDIKLPALTKVSDWKPPVNHPWRKFKINEDINSKV